MMQHVEQQRKTQALNIVERLRQHGFEALWVGGCVRDRLMGREPGDYDIVTDAAPQDVMRLFRRTIPVGVQFGIVIVALKEFHYEVAQFRTDTDNRDTRLREDAAHRDFTINAMFYDPFSEELFDEVSGQQDIQRQILRGIGDPRDRFEEDRLRVMRAARFASAFGYQIEPATLDAMRQYAPRITEVSVERIREELLRILTGPHPERGITILDEIGVLGRILPEVTALHGVLQPEKFHPEGDVWTHTLLMLGNLSQNGQPASPELALSVLLHDIGKPATFMETDRIRFHHHARVGAEMTEQICLRFKLSTDATEKIVTLVREHHCCFDVERMKLSTLKRLLRQDYIAELLELHRLDCVSSHGDLQSYAFCQQKLAEFRAEAMRPPKLITGRDLLDLGFIPGPVFKQVLEYIEDAQLEGTISTKVEALKLVEEIGDTVLPISRKEEDVQLCTPPFPPH